MESPVSNGFSKWEQKWKCLRGILLEEGNHSLNSMVICRTRCNRSLRGGTGSEVLIFISSLKSVNILCKCDHKLMLHFRTCYSISASQISFWAALTESFEALVYTAAGSSSTLSACSTVTADLRNSDSRVKTCHTFYIQNTNILGLSSMMF